MMMYINSFLGAGKRALVGSAALWVHSRAPHQATLLGVSAARGVSLQ
jgi:hypothetical protein